MCFLFLLLNFAVLEEYFAAVKMPETPEIGS